jgi:hypothetical protein
MRRLLFVLVVLVAGVAALGYYRGWFTVSGDADRGINMRVDKEKLKEDEEKAKAKLGGLKGEIQEKADELRKDPAAKAAGDGRK